MARKPSAVARELLRNFPKGGKKRRRKKKRKKGGGGNGASPDQQKTAGPKGDAPDGNDSASESTDREAETPDSPATDTSGAGQAGDAG